MYVARDVLPHVAVILAATGVRKAALICAMSALPLLAPIVLGLLRFCIFLEMDKEHCKKYGAFARHMRCYLLLSLLLRLAVIAAGLSEIEQIWWLRRSLIVAVLTHLMAEFSIRNKDCSRDWNKEFQLDPFSLASGVLFLRACVATLSRAVINSRRSVASEGAPAVAGPPPEGPSVSPVPPEVQPTATGAAHLTTDLRSLLASNSIRCSAVIGSVSSSGQHSPQSLRLTQQTRHNSLNPPLTLRMATESTGGQANSSSSNRSSASGHSSKQHCD